MRIAVAFFSVAVSAAAGFSAGRVGRAGDFDRHPWAQFPPGTQAAFRVVQTSRMGGTQHRTEATVTQRLVGEETLTIAGRQLRCLVVETVSEEGGSRAVTRMWQSPDVPGFIVKTEVTHPAMMSVQELISFSTGP